MKKLTETLAQAITGGSRASSQKMREGIVEPLATGGDVFRHVEARIASRLTAADMSAQYRGIPLDRTTPGSFDPSKPASARNLPPLDQLEFDKLGGGTGTNYLVWHRDEPIAVYKISDYPVRARNEASAWRADQMLGLDIVPFTREWVGPRNRGSLQDFVPNDGSNLYDLDTLDAQKIAVFDYIMASGDRHRENAIKVSGRPGKLAAIDNEDILGARRPNNSNSMRSAYIDANIGKDLDAGLVEHLRTVEPRGFSEGLQSMGYSRDTADWAAERLQEIQHNGKITGEAWDCAIMNEQFRVIYPPGYSSIVDYWKTHPAGPDEV